MAALAIPLILSLVLVTGVQAQNAAYGQCGGTLNGLPWCFNIDCQPGYVCTYSNAYYSQCLPITIPAGDLAPYVQCGGSITAPCSPGYACVTSNGYSMCTPIIYTALTTVNTCAATSTSTSSSTSTTLSTLTSSSSVKLSSSTKSSSTVQSTSSSKTSTLTSSTLVSSTLKSSTTSISPSSSIKSTSSSSSVITSTSVKLPSKNSSPIIVVSTSITTSAAAQQTPYGQCGGVGWTGPSACTLGWTCVPQAGNRYYSQCLPSTNSATSTPPTVSTSTTVAGPSTTTSVSSVSTASTTLSTFTSVAQGSSCMPTPQSCGTPAPCAGKVQFAGINIAGCDFGEDTNGDQQPSGAYCPLPALTGINGPGQMSHFVADGFNIFRLPTGWQYITNNGNTATSTLDPTNFGNYNTLVQACLATGAYCLIDIHNYARFSGAIIGQGGPSNQLFAQLWANIASQYASNSKVMFGIMNEPHDLPSVTTWAATVQAVVTAIRSAGATSQMILLPGNDWTSALSFVTDGSGPALQSVVNLDGSFTNLIFDVHKYLDSDGSGTGTICVSDEVQAAFAPLASWLRCNGRQALLSETGGSSDPTCLTYMCSAIAYLNANSDVYLGYTAWAAGSFSVGYNLGLTPSYSNGVWTDIALVTTCLIP